jgi:transposase
MPKRIDFTLTEADLQVIAQAVKSDKRPEVRQRAMGLRLLHEGQSPQEVARLMDVSQPTVYSWHHRWCENRLEGLAKRPKSGRPRKADATYVALLEAVIEQDPQALGYDFTVWTANRLRLHLEKETGVLLGATQFHELLKENEFVYRRPKHDLTDLQDATAREAATEWLDELKKKPKPERSTFSLWTKAA